MTPFVGFDSGPEAILGKKSVERVPDRPTILVATIDPEIRSGLTDLFDGFSINAVWLNTVEAAKEMLAKKKVSACLCGFWLLDGTYRELVRYIRRERLESPLIIVSPPSCPNEYRDYLMAANLGALDLLSHPYRQSELARMLPMATKKASAILQTATPVPTPVGAKEAA